MLKKFHSLLINLFLISTASADNAAGSNISPYYSTTVFGKNYTYDPWPEAVSPSNVWWVPLEYSYQQDDAIQAIVKPITYPDGLQGYELTIGTKLQKITTSQFKLAQAVGRLTYKLKDRSNGYCTATHVGNGYVVTAGHCLDDPKLYPDTCKALQVEWNFRRSRNNFPQEPSPDLIGQCQEIISWAFKAGDANTIDHAIFRVNNYPEAKVMIEPKPNLQTGDMVHQFSHPGAVPLVMAKNCTVTEIPFQYYQHDCWGASGSSGAALIDADTHKLIGILSMGSDQTFFSLRNDQSPIGSFDVEGGKISQ
ncbi:MAG: trypsin-like peptidase domain-containing protein [Gammaproteobacteria bacterium]|nr:trypsin-like peptidase domain-containing protein [Gammaproteobacteria bacterium]